MLVKLIELPELKIIEAVSYEDNKQKLLSLITAISPDITLPESSENMALLETFAYEMTYRDMSLNERFRQVLPTLAQGENLDEMCLSFYGTSRVDGEADEAFLLRSLYSLQQSTTAGAEWSYIYHAKSVDSRIMDVLPYRSNDGEVTISWHAVSEDADVLAQLQNDITTQLNLPDIRPLCTVQIIKQATVVSFNVEATLKLALTIDAELIKVQASSQVRAFTDLLKIGQEVKLSKLIALLHVEGVSEVVMVSPADTIVIDKESVAVCVDILLSTMKDTDA